MSDRDQAIEAARKLCEQVQFVCPDCGSTYFGTDPRFPGLVTCHAEGSDKPYRACWRGKWPRPEESQ